jgi:hypothetical protein
MLNRKGDFSFESIPNLIPWIIVFVVALIFITSKIINKA